MADRQEQRQAILDSNNGRYGLYAPGEAGYAPVGYTEYTRPNRGESTFVGESAAPVIMMGLNPYPTMLFRPQRQNWDYLLGGMDTAFNQMGAMMNNPRFLDMIRLAMRPAGGGGGGGGNTSKQPDAKLDPNKMTPLERYLHNQANRAARLGPEQGGNKEAEAEAGAERPSITGHGNWGGLPREADAAARVIPKANANPDRPYQPFVKGADGEWYMVDPDGTTTSVRDSIPYVMNGPFALLNGARALAQGGAGRLLTWIQKYLPAKNTRLLPPSPTPTLSNITPPPEGVPGAVQMARRVR